jgi:hypothetical protein
MGKKAKPRCFKVRLKNRRIRGWLMEDGDLYFRFRRIIRCGNTGKREILHHDMRLSQEAFNAMLSITGSLLPDGPTQVTEYEIWCEGPRATGNNSTAAMLGRAKGFTFKHACVELMQRIDQGSKYYNEKHNTYWACKLFDNEADARKAFG